MKNGIIVIMMLLSLAAQAKSTNKIVNLHVESMVSDVCPVLLRSAVKDMQGVKKVDASYLDHSATIEFDENKTSLEEIQQVIKSKVGFDTEIK